MDHSSIPSARSALKVLNYGTPLALTIYYLVISVLSHCLYSLQRWRPVSQRWRTRLIGMNFAITFLYFLQAASLLLNLRSAPDDSLVHALSQTLLWTFLSLITPILHSPIPSWGLIGSSVVLEIAICALTISVYNPDQPGWLRLLSAVQIVTILALNLLVAMVVWCWFGSTSSTTEERQPLLKNDSTPGSSLTNNKSPNTEVDGHEPDQSDADPPEFEIENEDEKELRAIQQKRLEQSGGWIGYLKSFMIFWPYIFPTNNLRLQFYFYIMLINIFLQSALGVLHPRQLGIVVDVLTKEQRVPWREIALWIALEIAADDYCGIGAISRAIDNRISMWSRQELTLEALDHVLALSMDFHDQKDSGEIIKAIDQAKSINSLVKMVTSQIIPGFLNMAISMFYVSYLFDVYATLIVIAVGIAYFFISYYGTTASRFARRVSAFKDRMQSKIVYESVSNWFTVMCLGRKDFTMFRLGDVISGAAKANLKGLDVLTYTWYAQELSEKLGRLAITVLAIRRIAAGISTIGDLINLEAYWQIVMSPICLLAMSYHKLYSDLIDAERLLNLFNEHPTVKDNPNAKTLGHVSGRMSFDHVKFVYPNGKTALLNFDLTAEPGQTIALVGETGSGKSTLVKLLMRFYDVSDGSISLDGHDVRDITLKSLRSSFGCVPQDTVLFNTTIAENVRYSKPSATDEEVVEACKAASIHDKILTFPRGYATKVGERGVKLSGGERQRIAIARVFLKNPQVVILDEATSAMDSQIEGKIQEALKELMKGRTTFVVAHRLSTVVDADQIFVIDQGEVIERGTHDVLLKAKGKYFQLWAKQAALMTL